MILQFSVDGLEMADAPLRIRQALPYKIRDLSRRTRKESEIYSDSAEYDFEYSDEDCLENELAELYAYSETSDLQGCQSSFEHFESSLDSSENWYSLSDVDKKRLICELLEFFEQKDVVHHSLGTQCILYILQGKYNECTTLAECLNGSTDNAFLVYECGFLPILLKQIHLQLQEYRTENRQSDHVEESFAMRMLLNTLYTMMCLIKAAECDSVQKQRSAFFKELSEPMHGYANLGLFMLEMIYSFEKGLSILPIKKITLIFWKYLLSTLGNMEDIAQKKIKIREENGLGAWVEPKDLPSSQWHVLQPQFPDRIPMSEMMEDESENSNLLCPSEDGEHSRRLPWKPKARQADVELYLRTCRQKFLGYQLEGDSTTMVGLPDSIQEGVKILQQHLYVSHGDLAMRHEDKMCNTPKRNRKILFFHPPAEDLYRAMLPKMEDYIIALLKVLLASASTPLSKAKTGGSLNVLVDVLPEDPNPIEPQRLQKDLNRHKEIITKAVSASLLLLLKHFRLNHVYQFEFISQCMFYANCIPLVLKFLNQDMNMYVTAENSIPSLDFPTCLFFIPPPNTGHTIIEPHDTMPDDISPKGMCWRNLFSTVNMLRIIQKLTKWRPPRTMMLNVFKSPPILKKTLKISHWLVHLYVLKLFKLQAKYLGKNWRKANMKILSSIYQHVRHRLLDDWAYGSDLDTRQWEAPTEEQRLKSTLQMYHAMWYRDLLPDTSQLPDLPSHIDDESTTDDVQKFIDDCQVELPKDFESNYKVWLEREVYDKEHDWDAMLDRFNYNFNCDESST